MSAGLRGPALAAGLAAALGALPSSAAAAPLTLVTPGARAVVHPRPFRLTIAPARGAPVLRTTESPGDAGGVSYAGLGYSVGAEEPELSVPRLGDSGPVLPGPLPLPERHAATRVTRAVRTERGLTLTLATDDPAGRTISLRVAPGPAGTIRVRAAVRGPGAVSAIALAFRSDRGEAFHGFGGRRESTNLRGRSFQSWVLDYRFPDASTGYYAPNPSFVSSHGYGLFLEGPRIARWRMGSDLRSAWRVSVSGPRLALTVAPGGARHAIRALTSITGRHRLPPAWSLGPTLSRTFGVIGDGQGQYRSHVEDDLRHLLHTRLPVSAYAFEGWGGLPKPFVRRVVARLRARGIRSLLYLRSFVSNDIAGTEQPGSFARAVSRGYVARTATGAPYLLPSPFPGAQAAVVDFTNPAAREWWARRVAGLLDTGARGFMNDFGEQVLPDMHFHDGSTGATMHNRYPVLQARTTRRAVDRWSRGHRAARVFFFQRAGFAGRPGSAAYENAQFPGDETVDWQPATGLPSIVPDMLNRAVGGAPGFTTDIGGYAQFTPEQPVMPATSPELFTRWAQASALTPFFRVHNSGLSGVRMPWSYGPATRRAWAAMARLHRLAEPLILRLWRSFRRTGIPMTRPLWLTDPVGGRGPRGDDEWMLGPNVLAAPVLRQGARARPVRLPPGCWRREGTGRALRGARTLRVPAPPAALPWFSRCGTRDLGPR